MRLFFNFTMVCIMKLKRLVLFLLIMLGFVSGSAFSATSITGLTELVSDMTTLGNSTVTTVGLGVLGVAVTVMGFKWAKQALFG